jgi:hypothetical protein
LEGAIGHINTITQGKIEKGDKSVVENVVVFACLDATAFVSRLCSRFFLVSFPYSCSRPVVRDLWALEDAVRFKLAIY